MLKNHAYIHLHSPPTITVCSNVQLKFIYLGQVDFIFGQVDFLYGQVDFLFGQVDFKFAQMDFLFGLVDFQTYLYKLAIKLASKLKAESLKQLTSSIFATTYIF